jgi:hypothetical protein
LTAS